MAFNAGSLVATFRLSLSGLEADKAKAIAAFNAAGAAADAAGKKADSVGDRAASGARKTKAAADQQAAAHRQAGNAAAQAGAKTAAAEDAAAAATKRAGDAATSTGRKAKAAGDEAAEAAKKAADATAKQNDELERVGRGVTAFGAAAAAGFGVAVAAQVQFGARQAQLRSLVAADVTNQVQLNAQMEQAATAALSYGTKFGQGVAEVQSAEIELQKAGVGVTEQMGGALTGALSLAAAGQLDVADATETATIAMTQYRLSAGEVPHLADLLSAGADKALGSVADLSMGLKQGGLVASQMGLSIDDTVGTLSAFAQAGLLGSDAGTSLKTMLLSLQSPSTQAQKYLDDLGISAYDSTGKFVGIVDLAEQLRTKLGGLSQAQRDAALSTIFGTDAIRSANVLYSQGGAGIQSWIDKVNDSGFAAQQAAGKLDSLEGDSQKLAASFQSGLVKAGRDLEPILRLMVQGASGVVTAFNQLDPVTGSIAIGLLGIVGAAGLAGGAILLAVPKIREFQIAARALAQSDIPVLSKGLAAGATGITRFRTAASSAAAFMGGPWGIALLAGTAALTLYNAAVSGAEASTETLEAAAGRGADGIDALTEAAARGQNEAQGFAGVISGSFDFTAEARTMDDLSAKLDHLTQSPLPAWLRTLGGQGDLAALQNTLDKVGTSLASVSQTNAPAAAQAFQALADKYKLTHDKQLELLDQMGPYKSALEASATSAGLLTGKESEAERTTKLLAYAHQQAATAADGAASSEADVASQLAVTSGAANDAAKDVKDLVDALKGLGSTQLDANDAQRAFEQAVDDAAEAAGKLRGGLNKAKTGFDLTSQAGRDGQEALDGIAKSAGDAAAASLANGDSQETVRAKIEAGRQAYIKAARAMGIGRDAAKKLADGLHLIPDQVDVLFRAQNAATVQQRIDDIKASMNNLDGKQADIYINARLSGVDPGRASQIAKNALQDRAGGGDLDAAPGPKGVDSMVFNGAKGEHVLTASDVDRMGGQKGVYAFRRDLQAGSWAGAFARGGAIGDAENQRAAAVRSGPTAKALAAQVALVKRLRREAAAAEKKADKAGDASAAVYGKGTGDAKHGAVLAARDARKAATAAEKKVKAAEKKLADLRSRDEKADSKAQQQADRLQTLTEGKQDLQVQLGRGELVDASNVYGAVDSARSLSRDENLTKAQRKALSSVVSTQEKALQGLAQQAKDAAAAVDRDNEALSNAQDAAGKADSALDSMKSTMQQLSDQVASTVAGFFDLGGTLKQQTDVVTAIVHNAGTAAEWSEKRTSVTPGGTTAGAIRSAVLSSASSSEGFAAQLQQLVARGYSTAVVQDVARLGVEQGSQIASALLAATNDEVRDINSGYARSAAAGVSAGTTVSQQAYGGQVAQLQQAADAAHQQVTLAQAQLDQDKANADRVNQSITQAQQAIVNAMLTAYGSKKANGGIVEAFASGGIRQAQIAPGGRNILWAEPETGGEAYIPFAASKRPRSLAILSETARRMGMSVVPAGSRPMAAGGIVDSSSTTTYGGDTYYLSGTWLGTPASVLAAGRRDAAARKARANRSAMIGRVNA